MNDAKRRRQTWLICLGLAVAVLAAYGQVWRHAFINYDDPDYVTSNPHVRGGVTWAGVVWAFTTGYAANWHPLTWLSHMLDFQLYGMNPAGHHLTNVALHLANSILLFLLLQRLTTATWPSASVAALFALHPLHVESVAWVAERKDVLSALFWILSIWAWVCHVQESEVRKGKGGGSYILSVVLFALGLMAKPMLVTLPFVLLLLDYWPLQRRQIPIARLFAEKTPFFILAALSCAVTFFVQRRSGAVVPMSALSFGARVADAPVAYVRYMAKIFWPAHLAIAYPLFAWPDWMVAGSALILLLCTGWALWRIRSQPWLMVGWLWFLGTLVPVIGVVQVGLQSIADRYAYIPSIGLFIAVVWAGRNLGARMPALFGALVIGICLLLTRRQAACWKDSGTLLRHAIQSTTNNFVAYAMLGTFEAVNGNTNAALRELETSVRINPEFANSRNKLGHVLLGLGRIDEALAQLQQAVALNPTLPDAHYNLGYALLAKNRVGEALDQFQAQVNLQPGNFQAQYNMGAILLQNGLAGDAVAFLQKAVEINPEDADACSNLANALFRTGRVGEAMRQFEKALQLDPENIQARNDLAWILACNSDPSVRNGARAVKLARRADELSGGKNPVILGTLAAGYAEAGRFADAIAASQRAGEMALDQTNRVLAELLEKRLRRYQAGLPWRDTASHADFAP